MTAISINISDIETYASNSMEAHILSAAKEIILRNTLEISARGLRNKKETVEEPIIMKIKEKSEKQLTVSELLKNGETVDTIIAKYRLPELIPDIVFSEFKKAGIYAENLYKAGIDINQLKQGGYNVSCLITKESIEQLIDRGYKYRDMYNENLVDSIIMHRFSVKKWPTMIEHYVEHPLRMDTFTNNQLVYLRHIQEFTAKHMIDLLNVPIKQLLAVFNVLDLKNAGVSAENLYKANIDILQLKKAGFDVDSLVSKYSIEELIDAGHTYTEIYEAGLIEIQRMYRCNVKKWPSMIEHYVKYPLNPHTCACGDNCACGDKELKYLRDIQEFTAKHMISSLKIISIKRLLLLFSVADLKEAGVSALELFNNGIDIFQLKKIGFGVNKFITKASIEQLIDLGHTYTEMFEANFVNIAIMYRLNVNKCSTMIEHYVKYALNHVKFSYSFSCSAEELKYLHDVQEFTAKNMHDLNISGGFCSQLLKLYSVAELKDAGFTLRCMIEAGVSISQLKEAGFTLRCMIEAGVSISQLKEAGFTLWEFGQLNFNMSWTDESVRAFKQFGVKELLKHKFPLSLLLRMGFTDAEILSRNEE